MVVLLSDDQRADTVTAEYMPNVWHDLVAGGSLFQDAFVPNPLCCPSRASIFTGNYSHTTGVWSNVTGEHGGLSAFAPSESSTLATDFDGAGYRTLLVGKYINGYFPESMYVPPGWERWFAIGKSSRYYDYTVNVNGKKVRSYGGEPDDYIVRVQQARVLKFVERSGSSPFLLFWSFNAPHWQATADPRDVDRFEGETDSPAHDKMLDSAYSMDRAIGRLLDVLPPNTIVAYLSDNGFLWGESKAGRGELRTKQWPYDESIRIPFILTALDGSVGSSDGIALNVDLRETLGALAGVSTPPTDGIDLRSESRSVFPIEHLVNSQKPQIPSYCGAREVGWMYVRYQDGVEELFREPDEVTNLIADPANAGVLGRLRDEARTLCDPVPPGYSWTP